MTRFTSYINILSLFIVSTAFVYCNISFHEVANTTHATQSLAMLNSENIVAINGLDNNSNLTSDSVAVNLMDSQKVIKKTHLINNKVGTTLEKKPKKPLILKKIVVL